MVLTKNDKLPIKEDNFEQLSPLLYLEEVGFCLPFNLSHGHVQFLNTQNDKLSIDNFKKLSPPSYI